MCFVCATNHDVVCCVCVCVRACVCACVCVYMRACVHACVPTCICVILLWDYIVHDCRVINNASHILCRTNEIVIYIFMCILSVWLWNTDVNQIRHRMVNFSFLKTLTRC